MKEFSSKRLREKIFDVQKKWANGIVRIGKAYREKKDYVKLTNEFLDNLYYFEQGKVLFKPTKAIHKQFRRNKNEFISYFIGYNPVSEEDKGFALEPWKKISFQNFDYSVFENVFLSLGNYFFTDYRDKEIKVEYSFGYILNRENELRIIYHHSSIPYKKS